MELSVSSVSSKDSKRNLIWSHFTQIGLDKTNIICSVCNHCKKELKCGGTGTTSSMINYLTWRNIAKCMQRLKLKLNRLRVIQVRRASASSVKTLASKQSRLSWQAKTIDCYDFIRTVIAIMDRRTAKQNCFFLHGDSNSGKTLLLCTTLHTITTFPALISTVASSNEFMWMPILGTRAVFGD